MNDANMIKLYLISINSALAFLSLRLMFTAEKGKFWAFIAWFVTMAPSFLPQIIQSTGG